MFSVNVSPCRSVSYGSFNRSPIQFGMKKSAWVDQSAEISKAVEERDADLVTTLLRRVSDPGLRRIEVEKNLFSAIEESRFQTKCVRALLGAIDDLDTRKAIARQRVEGFSYITWAHRTGNPELVDLFRGLVEDLRLENRGYPPDYLVAIESPLHQCVRKGEVGMAQGIIEMAPVNINRADPIGRTPLLLAATQLADEKADMADRGSAYHFVEMFAEKLNNDVLKAALTQADKTGDFAQVVEMAKDMRSYPKKLDKQV